MASRWIVKRKNKEQGPFSSQQLKRLAEKGQLRTTDWVRKHDSEHFVKAEKVKGLFDAPPSKTSKPKPAKTNRSEKPVAEVAEGVEDSPLEVVGFVTDHGDDGYEDYEADEYDDFDEYDDYGDYDDYDGYEEYEEPAPRRRGSDRRGSALQSTRRGRGKTRRKKTSSTDDDEDGPWQNLLGGVGCLALGVFLFIAIGPGGAEITGWGIITWIIMILNKIGGRWAILVFFTLAAIACFHDSYKKFTER